MVRKAAKPVDDDALDLPGLDAPDEVEGEADVETEPELEADESLESVESESVDVEPDLDEVYDAAEEGGEEELDLEEITAALELADDPVRLYLKEIGRVELLGPDQELWLALRMEAARRLDLLAAVRSGRRKTTDPPSVRTRPATRGSFRHARALTDPLEVVTQTRSEDAI